MTASRALLFLLLFQILLGNLFAAGLYLQQHFYRKAWKFNPETGDREYQEKKPKLVAWAHRIQHENGTNRPNKYFARYREFIYSVGDSLDKALFVELGLSVFLNLFGY